MQSQLAQCWTLNEPPEPSLAWTGNRNISPSLSARWNPFKGSILQIYQSAVRQPNWIGKRFVEKNCKNIWCFWCLRQYSVWGLISPCWNVILIPGPNWEDTACLHWLCQHRTATSNWPDLASRVSTVSSPASTLQISGQNTQPDSHQVGTVLLLWSHISL